MILESVKHEKIQADCDLKATNIILQGLPSDIYSLVKHHRVANDLWERIQLLMQVNQQTHLAKVPQIDSGLEVPVFKRQTSFAAGMSGTRANILGMSGNKLGQQRVLKCFNCQGEGSGKVLNEEELEFLADLGVAKGPVTQTVITHNAMYQADDLDAYDSDCDDFSTSKAVLMANLSSYGSDVLVEVVQIVLWYLNSGCSKHMTRDRSQLTNFVHKFLDTVKFGNGQIQRIIRVMNLEVSFRKHTCYVHNLEGVDLLSGSQETNLYTLSIGDMMASSPICLSLQSLKNKSWLWHRRLSHLNFGAINHLAKHGLVRGIWCCSVMGNNVILVIGAVYSRFHGVKFLASKDEAPDFIIKFVKIIQVRLNATSGTFIQIMELSLLIKPYKTTMNRLASLMKHQLRELHNKMVLLKGEIVLVEAAHTMLIFTQAPLFL
ncbi:retrovirus-related pol polyprotein from transposon TNT 1-94 [Tanacetum coccineum]